MDSAPDARRAFFYSSHASPHYSTLPQSAMMRVVAPLSPAVSVQAVPARASSVTPPLQPLVQPIAPPPAALAHPGPTETKPAVSQQHAISDSDLLEDEVILFAPQAESNVDSLLASSVDDRDSVTPVALPQMEAPPDDDDLVILPKPVAPTSPFTQSPWHPFSGGNSFFSTAEPGRAVPPPGFSAYDSVCLFFIQLFLASKRGTSASCRASVRRCLFACSRCVCVCCTDEWIRLSLVMNTITILLPSS